MLWPCSPDGPTLTIRKFGRRFRLAELVASGAMTAAVVTILRAAIAAHQTILISGGTSTGKTTLLNALTECLDPMDRIDSD